jgi:putative oxidoreductase
MISVLGNPLPTPVRDAVLVLARVVLGTVFIAHGWQKVDTFGLDGTAAAFAQMSVPFPEASAAVAAVIELGGGALLLLGLLTPVAAVLLAAQMAGAYWFAHRGAGVLSAEGGWELVAVLAVGALVVGAAGPGRISLDRLVARLLGGRREPVTG